MDALVASQLLRQASTRHAIAADGGVTALAICA
jgi:hypothetical protein